MPAQAGIQSSENCLDSRLRGNDGRGQVKFYATIGLMMPIFSHHYIWAIGMTGFPREFIPDLIRGGNDKRERFYFLRGRQY
jgi:hypothetical protein